MPNSWLSTIKTYQDIRLLWVFLMGVTSGFPWVLIGSSLSGWLKDEGISRGEIGLLGSVSLIYALNFLWAPLVDRLHIPFLAARLGQRRSWILCTQLSMLLAVFALTQITPSAHLGLFAFLAFWVALSSATQDIAVDAFRIEQFSTSENDKTPAAAAVSVIGWWTGYSWPGYLAFSSADQIGWNQVYGLMMVVLLALIAATLLVREPRSLRDQLQHQAEVHMKRLGLNHASAWLAVTVWEPFAEFFRRNGVQIALSLLLFIFLFKIGEAFLGRMSVVFYRELGFSNEQIGQYSKLFGWFLTVLFTLMGSVFNTRFGVLKGLLVGGIAMAGSNLMFAAMAEVGPEPWLFIATLMVDNFTAAFSSVALVAFLSSITGRAFSATQYALLASLGSLGRSSMAGASGYLVDILGSWTLFFVVTTLMVLPSLLILWSLRHKIKNLSND